MSFCKNCGVELNAPAAFCPSCGTKSAQMDAGLTVASPSSTAMQSLTGVKTNSAAMKVVLVVAGFLLCALVGLAYAGYWVKTKVQSVAAAHGITLPTDEGSAVGSKTDSRVLDACALISPDDANAVLGTPGKISEHQKDDRYSSHCAYESVDVSNGVNNFGVEIHNDENSTEARNGQTIKQTIYSNVSLYTYQELTGIGDGAFLAVSKAPEGAAFQTGPLASMVARQQILMTFKGTKEIEIIASYFGKERSPEELKALMKTLADKV
jgi:hypothetical protein